MIPCPKCGCRNPDGYRFCCECHALLAAKRDVVGGIQKDLKTGTVQDNLSILPMDVAPLDTSSNAVYEIGRLKFMATALAVALVLYIGIGIVARRADNNRPPAINKASGAGINRAFSQGSGASPPKMQEGASNPSGMYSKQDDVDKAGYRPPQKSKLDSKNDEGDGDRTDRRGEEGRTTSNSGNIGIQTAKKQEAIIYINKAVAEKKREAPSVKIRDSSYHYMRTPMLPPIAYPEAPSQPLIMAESTPERLSGPEKRESKSLMPTDTVSGNASRSVSIVVPGVKRRTDKPAAASAYVNLDMQQVAYQESIADTYIRLGQNKEAVAILEKLLKRELSADDRDRIVKKLRECGD
ncbi:MAG: zinc ribbon domain-containing protein [bacterium]|nr:zinc ribbon domain-containing protein [bacterium]